MRFLLFSLFFLISCGEDLSGFYTDNPYTSFAQRFGTTEKCYGCVSMRIHENQFYLTYLKVDTGLCSGQVIYQPKRKIVLPQNPKEIESYEVELVKGVENFNCFLKETVFSITSQEPESRDVPRTIDFYNGINAYKMCLESGCSD